MAQNREINTKCPKCGNYFKVEVFDGINVGDTPELKEKVMDGSLFIAECPYCGTRKLLSYSTVYHDPEAKLMIWLNPDGGQVSDNIKTLFLTDENLKHYTARLVSSVGTLIEKVKILNSGLDDLTMEMCKYITRMEMGKPDIDLKFVSVNGADNEITMTYASESQMEMISIGFNVYEDCRGIIMRNPAINEAATGIIELNAQWLANYLA